MSPRISWEWRPTEAQRKLFEEWRNLTIGYLVSSREGVNIRSIPNFLEESTGESIPLDKMGFRTMNQFIYEMADCVETRTLNGKFFVFIREAAVPDRMRNIRQLVLGQAKDKGCKTKTGVIKRPTKAQSNYCRPEDLLVPVQHIITKTGPILGYQRPVPVSSGVSNMRRPGAPMNSGIRQNPRTGGQGRPTQQGLHNSPAPRSPRKNVRNSGQSQRPVVRPVAMISRPSAVISSWPTSTAASRQTPTISSRPIPTIPLQITVRIPSQPNSTATYRPNSTVSSRPTPMISSRPAPTISSRPTPSVPSKPTPSVPSKPTPSVPSKPTPSVPSKPTPSVPSKPTPTISSRPAPTVPSKPTSMANTSIPSRPTLTAISSPTPTMPSQPTSTATPRPLRGITLDTDCVLSQFIPNHLMHDYVVRMSNEIPTIKFPPFFRGGSVKANLSLRQYLAEVNDIACA